MKITEVKKWIGPLFLGIVVGAGIMALIWYYTPCAPTSPVLPLQTVSPEDAARFTKDYGQTLQPYNDYVKAYYISARDVEYLYSILYQNPEKKGLRFYPAVNEGRPLGIIATTDESGKEDAETYYMIESPSVGLCPPVCDTQSPILYPCPPNCDRD